MQPPESTFDLRQDSIHEEQTVPDDTSRCLVLPLKTTIAVVLSCSARNQRQEITRNPILPFCATDYTAKRWRFKNEPFSHWPSRT
uniref:Ricin B lectin domain-containing protein n=1 Tax=Mesocestoides corti TaxID=53468 RepID=A0A5K3ENC3_MESCO